MEKVSYHLDERTLAHKSKFLILYNDRMQALIYLLFSCRISSAGPNKPLPANSREGSEIRNIYPSHVSEAPITVKKLKTLEGYVGFANLPNQVYRLVLHKKARFKLY